MANPELQTAKDFILEKVELTADRFSTVTDLTNTVIEINIYESIESLFLTGSLIFLDDNGLLSGINLSGTERIKMQFKLPSADAEIIERNFIVSAVKDQVKGNERGTVVQLLLIQDLGYLSQVKKFSKSYTGTPEQILTKICKDQLNVDLVVLGKSVQESFKVLVPYMTVEQSLYWILNKATSKNGAPFFLFSTFQSDNLYLIDLETILKSQPDNKDNPFIYSSAWTNKQNLSLANQGRVIESLKFKYQDDTINFAKQGYFGSNYATTAIDNNITNTYHHSIVDVYNKLANEDIIEGSQTVPIVDDLFNINDKKLQDYDSRYFHQLSFSTFEDSKNYYEEQSFGVTRNRLTSKALINLLHKDSIEINVAGLMFLVKGSTTGAGSNVEVSILNTHTIDESITDLSDAIIDKKHSGAYMIFNKRHLFNKRGQTPRHIVSLTLCRLTRER